MPNPRRLATGSIIAQEHATELVCDARLPSLLQAAWQQSQGELFDKLDKWLEQQERLVDGLLQNNIGKCRDEHPLVSRVGQCEDKTSLRILRVPEPLPEPHDSAEPLEPLRKQPEPPGPAMPPIEQLGESEESAAEEFAQGKHSGRSQGTYGRAKTCCSDRGWLAVEKSQSYQDAQDVSIAIISNQQAASEGTVHKTLQNVSERIISNWRFDFVLSLAVFLNAVLIGVEVNWAATHLQAEDLPEFEVMQHCFTAVFFLELLFRACAGGCAFFCASSWNILDTTLVFASLLEVCLAFFFTTASDALNSSSNLRILRIIRMTRLAKLVRIVRFVRFVRALRTLTMSIVSTLKSLVWSMLLLASILFIFGVLFTDVTTTHLSDVPGPWDPSSAEAVLSIHFNSIPRSMLTLYACILNGLEWSDIAYALETVGWFYRLVFDAYISFACLAFLNVVTGVFCHSAIESAQRDHDMLVNSMIQNKEFFLGGLEKLFKAIDDDKNGAITITEFERHFDDVEVKNLLEALGLDPADAWSLFSALDTDNTHTLNAQEFLEGCLYVRGTAKAIDIAHVKKDLRKIKEMLM
eukprot:TRINITY_DN10619_c0_g1_i5.p1 TRINITY_DN10619_c0_g1~~TRINITY_DN10619_c0_g1_i5.p1  ORF type:complete len:594 (+),score=72.64 TRINITY_DN10619_c0_g1_i5:47-1783(+)